jgi:starch synthase
MKITILASEAVPFAKTGGLGDVIMALSKELVKSGHQVTVMLPLYQGISVMPTGLMSPLRFLFAGRHITYSIVEAQYAGIKMVFIDAPDYFHRSGIYGDWHGDYRDNDERFVFFTRACLDYYVRKNERPDIFHCNDWQTALTPVFLKTHYHAHPLGRIPVVFTVHNVAYQGVFPSTRFFLLDIGWEYFTSETLEFFGNVNFMKGGLIFTDLITTVSKRYSYEIQTPEFGYKLDGVFRSRSGSLFGILNGIDEEIWNPEKDPLIARRYSLKDLTGKNLCRRELLTSARWNPDTSLPIVGIISRLVTQKGFDLLEAAGERLLSMNLFLVVLGSGESRYEKFFESLRQRYPDRVALALKFDDVLAHKIEAGADMFLMPSRYEPCGLNQMYSLKYGTVPIVRATGGLDDTVHEWDWNSETGNGFKFYPYSPEALLESAGRARNLYENKSAWLKIMQNGMSGDYSWKNAARQYVELYEKAVQLKS